MTLPRRRAHSHRTVFLIAAQPEGELVSVFFSGLSKVFYFSKSFYCLVTISHLNVKLDVAQILYITRGLFNSFLEIVHKKKILPAAPLLSSFLVRCIG